MAASCSVLDSSLAELAKENIIDREKFIINKILDFEEYNDVKTRIAQDVYKVDLNNEKLFNYWKTPNNNWVFQANGKLFDAVQKVKDKYNVKFAEPLVSKNFDTNSPVTHYKLMSEEEAKNKNIGGLSTSNFLDSVANKEGFDTLQNLFFRKLGLTYKPLDNSKAGQENNMNFYKFLSSKGYNGFVYGEDFAVSFDFKNGEDVQTVTALESSFNNPQFSFFDENLEPTTPALNQIEKIGNFTADEINTIKSVYSQTEIDDYMAKDPQEAMIVFQELLYDKLWKNSNFVSKSVVNNFNRICR
jgi:hypothetical protein